ncbi:hypothetical protein [Nocardioides ferulae]|uniref:hypothetical protein n=1 Tax=Nocardioides ferulae TaxID=2340821 RepID=UPI000F895CED|nr:hypothetical protein [Nocardioides ferulae]
MTLASLSDAAGWTAASAAAQSEEEGAVEVAKRRPAAALPPGCVVRAIEVLHFPNYSRPTTADGQEPEVRKGHGDLDSFVVVHVMLTGQALADPGAAAAYFALPAANTDVRLGYGSKDPQGMGQPLRVMTFQQWARLLSALGFDPIGPTGTKVDPWRTKCALRAWRPFVLSHLVPEGEVPPSPFRPRGGATQWSAEQEWAWRMTGGQRLTQAWEPGRGVDDAVRDGLWLGSTWARATATGMAFVGTRGVGERGTVHEREGAVWWRKGFHNVEHARTAGLVHRNAVRLAALTIRQSEKLQTHAEELATGVTWPSPPPAGAAPDSPEVLGYLAVSEEVAEQALALELRLIRARNQVWFSQLPGRQEETGVLRSLQSAAGVPELLADIEVEQTQVTRVLEQQASRVRAAHDKRSAAAAAAAAEAAAERLRLEDLARQERREADAAARQQTIDAAQDAKDRQEKRDREVDAKLTKISLIIGLFFIADLAFAIAQVQAGGGWGDVWITAAVAGPLMAVLGVVFWQYSDIGSSPGDDGTT